MKIVSLGDNFHEMSKHCFCEKEEKYSKMSSADFSQHAERKRNGIIIHDFSPRTHCKQPQSTPVCLLTVKSLVKYKF